MTTLRFPNIFPGWSLHSNPVSVTAADRGKWLRLIYRPHTPILPDKKEGQRPVRKCSLVRVFWCHATWPREGGENNPVRLPPVRCLAL